MKDDSKNVNDEKPLRDNFVSILVHDVISAEERRDVSDSQTNKRDMIRTMFAAIEGHVWIYREHVRSMVNDVDTVPAITDLALSEITYSVSDKGEIEQQVRFVPMPAMIRLTTRLAQSICPQLKVDFSGAGWSNLKQAILIRNRITHPKSKSDLNISDEDIAICQAGFLWVLALIVDVMEATTATSAQFLAQLRLLSSELLNGDKQALADYQRALRSM